MTTGTKKSTDMFEVILWVLAIVVVGMLVAHYGFGFFPKPERGW